jgi:hypothetical protein
VFAEITKGMAVLTLYGTACALDDCQILFQRESYCVSVTTDETGARTLTAMAALAAKIDAAVIALSR